MDVQPFDLNLRHLRAVAAIVAGGNMGAAAEAVSLSQPALTQGLAKLEAQLGQPLFHRRPDGMAPTVHGTILAERAAAAFRHLAEATRAGGRGFARPERLITATQLRAFVALADAGSFSGAAEHTRLSQPAIHRAVRDLEQVLAAPLAERRGRGVALTASGHRMARGARLARAEIVAAIADIGRGENHPDSVVIGAMPLCRARLLPDALVGLAAVAPATRVTVIEGSWHELVEPLRDGAIDLLIGALREGKEEADLAQRRLFDDRPIVVAGPHHPLAGATDPPMEALARYPWVVGRDGSPLRLLWQRLFDGRTLPPCPIACGSVMTIRGILRQTDYLALLSADQVAMELAGGTLVRIGRPLDRCVRTIGVIHRAGWRPTGAQAALLSLLSAARVREFE